MKVKLFSQVLCTIFKSFILFKSFVCSGKNCVVNAISCFTKSVSFFKPLFRWSDFSNAKKNYVCSNTECPGVIFTEGHLLNCHRFLSSLLLRTFLLSLFLQWSLKSAAAQNLTSNRKELFGFRNRQGGVVLRSFTRLCRHPLAHPVHCTVHPVGVLVFHFSQSLHTLLSKLAKTLKKVNDVIFFLSQKSWQENLFFHHQLKNKIITIYKMCTAHFFYFV